MDNEYISIKDFALKAGKSQQAIYKQVERKLQTYVKMVDNQRMIDTKALEEVYGIKVEQPIQPKVEQVEQSIQPENKIIMDMLQCELDKKNEQIASLEQMLKDKEENHHKEIMELQRNLDQAQKLNAMDKQRILELESKEEPEPQEETPPDEPKKKWWNKFF